MVGSLLSLVTASTMQDYYCYVVFVASNVRFFDDKVFSFLPLRHIIQCSDMLHMQ